MRVTFTIILLAGCPPSKSELEAARQCDEERKTWWIDQDDDGFGCDWELDSVCPETPHPSVGVCETDGSLAWVAEEDDLQMNRRRFEGRWYSIRHDDCDDNAPAVNPDAAETVCADREEDGVDNDCDGEIDESGTQKPCYPDVDGDGYFTDKSELTCLPAGQDQCGDAGSDNKPNEDVIDCKDNDISTHPGATEEECADDLDQDCDDLLNCSVAGSITSLEGGSARVLESDATTIVMRGLDLDYVVDEQAYGDLAFVSTVSAGVLFGSASIWMDEPGVDFTLVRDSASDSWPLSIGGYEQALIVADPETRIVEQYPFSSSWGESELVDSAYAPVLFGATVALAEKSGSSAARWATTFVECELDKNRWQILLYEGTESRLTLQTSIGSNAACSSGNFVEPPQLGFAALSDDQVDDLLVLDVNEPFTLTLLLDPYGLDDAEADGIDIDEDGCLIEEVDAFAAVQCPRGMASSDRECIALTRGETVTVYQVSDACLDDDDDGVVSVEAPSGEALPVFSDFGLSLSGAGDVDGDGYEDLLVGATGAAFLYLTEVMKADDGTETVTFGSAPYATFYDASLSEHEYHVAGGSDLDGDGFDDMAILVDGTIYLFPGGPPDSAE